MSSDYSFHITYTVPSGPDAVRKTLEAARAAVHANWRHADAWSPPEPEIVVSHDSWMDLGRSEGKESEGSQGRVLSFLFSPVSDVFVHIITGGRGPAEPHTLLLTVSVHVTCGDLGEREAAAIEACWDEERRKQGLPPSLFSDWTDEDDPLHEWQAERFERWADLRGQSPPAWPTNRVYLLNVFETLKSVFPVEKVTIYDPSTDTYGTELPPEFRDEN